MKISVEKIEILFLVTVSVLIVWYLGVNQIVEQNEYMGMRELKLDVSFFLSLSYLILFVVVFFKTNLNSPEGILISIFLFYAIVWFIFFYSVSGYASMDLIFFGGSIFFIPILLFSLSDKHLKINYNLKSFSDGLLKIRAEFVITVVLVTVAIFLYKKMGVSFTFNDSYERRILARDEINGFLTYIFAMGLNGLAPLLAFLATYNKKYKYLFIAVTFAFLGFGFIGTKAPIAYVVLMSLMGGYLSRGGKRIVLMIVLAMTSLMFLALLEYLLFGFSWIADIYIRRAVLVVPQIHMYFLDFIFNVQNSMDAILVGVDYGRPVTFVIGEMYFSNPLTNANTISLLTELGRNGLMGYSFHILFILIFYSVISHLYRVSKHEVWRAISALYALLLLEQSYSTAFVTSGIGLSVLILILFDHRCRSRYIA